MSAQDKGLNIVFMGSPDFACPTLQALMNSPHHISHVLTQPPRAAGRGMAERQTPVAALAQANAIPVTWPTQLHNDIKEQLSALNADLFVVVAYGLILPQHILDIPRLGCLNGHASLLPRWRGAAPIQRAIEAGDAQTGTCAMMMEAGLDTGPVITSALTDIDSDDTAESLHDRLATMTADTLLAAIAMMADGTAQPVAQSQDGITYAAKIQKSDAALDLSNQAQSLKRQIHAFSPFPGGFLTGDSGKRLKCLHALILSGTHNSASGAYLGQTPEGAMMIACGNGTILGITWLQPAGKKPMSAADFLRGKPLDVGTIITAQI